MESISELGKKGRRLLALLIAEIRRGGIKPNEPRTFLTYGEALDGLGVPRNDRAGICRNPTGSMN